MVFKLFNKNIEEIGQKDIESLVVREIKEGWFVEYKSKEIRPMGLAKVVSSFANQNGGWLFVGVMSDQNNCIQEICGHSIGKENIYDWIRNSIAGNLSPVPEFKVKIVEMTEGREVIVLCVEKGSSAPYICSDGKIYNRVDCASEPVKDKYTLNELYKRRDEVVNLVEYYSSQEYMVSKKQSEQNIPYLEIQIFPENFNRHRIDNFNSIQELEMLKDIFNNIKVELTPGSSFNFRIKFDKVYFSYDSIILNSSSMKPYSHIDLGLNIEIRADGTLKTYLPLVNCALDRKHAPFYLKRDTVDYLIKEIGAEDSSFIQLIDGFGLYFLAMKIIGSYRAYINQKLDINTVSMRVKLGNVWRKLLVFESDEYKEVLKKYGLPICMKDVIEVPHFIGGSCLRFNWKKFDHNNLFVLLVGSLGLPPDKSPEFFRGVQDYIKKFNDYNLRNDS